MHERLHMLKSAKFVEMKMISVVMVTQEGDRAASATEAGHTQGAEVM